MNFDETHCKEGNGYNIWGGGAINLNMLPQLSSRDVLEDKVRNGELPLFNHTSARHVTCNTLALLLCYLCSPGACSFLVAEEIRYILRFLCSSFHIDETTGSYDFLRYSFFRKTFDFRKHFDTQMLKWNSEVGRRAVLNKFLLMKGFLVNVLRRSIVP